MSLLRTKISILATGFVLVSLLIVLNPIPHIMAGEIQFIASPNKVDITDEVVFGGSVSTGTAGQAVDIYIETSSFIPNQKHFITVYLKDDGTFSTADREIIPMADGFFIDGQREYKVSIKHDKSFSFIAKSEGLSKRITIFVNAVD